MQFRKMVNDDPYMRDSERDTCKEQIFELCGRR